MTTYLLTYLVLHGYSLDVDVQLLMQFHLVDRV